MLVWLNGALIDADDARVSVFDAGFQHGVGLFETMSARHGVVFRVHEHMARLAESARELLLTENLHVGPLAEAVQLTVTRNELEKARIRLTVTGGAVGAAPSAASEGGRVDPTITISAQRPTQYPDEFFEKGVIVTIADGRLNPLDPMVGHKTLNYWARIRALQVAAARGAGEALWFTVSNHLASGSVSNVALVHDEQVTTPIARGEETEGALRAPVLPGITRAVMMEAADRLGLEMSTRTLDIEEVLSADEIFLTNSSWGVLPVVGVEREKIGEGTVGPVTADLRAAWLETVESETSAQ